MRYVYTDASGEEITLKVDRVEGQITHLVDSGDDEVVISAQQLYDDLVNEISLSGSHYARCYEVITDRYMREHTNVSWDSLTSPLRKRLVAYLESLRADAGKDFEDSFYNDGEAWKVDDLSI